MCSVKSIVVVVALASLMCGCATNGEGVSTDEQIILALIGLDIFQLLDDGPTNDEWNSLLDHVQLLIDRAELRQEARDALQIAVTTAQAELERGDPFEDVVETAITAIRAALDLRVASPQPDESP